ncbi:hypothetical protein [Anaerosolibacter sp.]|uniref:hypothetical protein n=1 Tax=Anaerosolibacter sp. TaxID=1872527 RepID=UPI0039F0FDD8
MRFSYNRKFTWIALLLSMIIIQYTVRVPVLALRNIEKHVLILNSYHKGYKWTDDMVEGIEDVLKSDLENINLSVEYLDGKRIHGELYFQKLNEIYKHKYESEKFDIILLQTMMRFTF